MVYNRPSGPDDHRNYVDNPGTADGAPMAIASPVASIPTLPVQMSILLALILFFLKSLLNS